MIKTLNVRPETLQTETAQLGVLPPSPHWPMYARPVLLHDVRVFYFTRRPYGANNGRQAPVPGTRRPTSARLQVCFPTRSRAPFVERASSTRSLTTSDDHGRWSFSATGTPTVACRSRWRSRTSMAAHPLTCRSPRRNHTQRDASVRHPDSRPTVLVNGGVDDGGERDAGRALVPRSTIRTPGPGTQAGGRWRPSRGLPGVPLPFRWRPVVPETGSGHRPFPPPARRQNCGSRCSFRRTCSGWRALR